ncbi:MAG: sulfite exporter TauE/SafE family protein [Candidatus Microthrix sp.]|nr:sulfite exporter TauE/SafE family protein [Candidatus Microthrix sp.]
MSWIDPGLVIGGLAGGFTMGLTGMGGGALLTPMLVLLFGVSPTAAVGSDLVTSLAVKPFGGAIHARAGTVRWDLVRWLALGSVPGALLGVALLQAVGTQGDSLVQTMLGITLLAAATVMVWPRPQPGLRPRRPTHPGATMAHRSPRAGRRHGRRPHLGGLRLADDRRAHPAVPQAPPVRTGRHRPGPSRPARRRRSHRPPRHRQCVRSDHRLTHHRQPPGRHHRRPRIGLLRRQTGARRHPRGPRRLSAQVVGRPVAR